MREWSKEAKKCAIFIGSWVRLRLRIPKIILRIFQIFRIRKLNLAYRRLWFSSNRVNVRNLRTNSLSSETQYTAVWKVYYFRLVLIVFLFIIHIRKECFDLSSSVFYVVISVKNPSCVLIKRARTFSIYKARIRSRFIVLTFIFNMESNQNLFSVQEFN